jgi:predicted ferric reductase
METLLRGVVWFSFYVFLILVPLVVAAIFRGEAGGRTFLIGLGVACGYVGLSIMVFQFALISRVKSVSGAFGQDVLERFHREMGYVAAAFLIAHPILLILGGYPWGVLNPFWEGNLAMWRWGALALYTALPLIALATFRKALHVPYEWWQWSHAGLATLAVCFGVAHMFLLGNYSASVVMRVLWAVYTLVFVGLAVWYRIIRPLYQWRRPWRLVANKAERGDAHTLVLHPQGHDGMAFEPGQFAWLSMGRTPFHFEQHPISISSSAEVPKGGDVAFTIKALGDWSAKVVPEIQPGTSFWVDGPYGVFSPDWDQGPGYVLIAGGIGITPLRSMCETLADRGDVRPVILFYGGRDWEGLTFREELDALASRMNLKIVYVLEQPGSGWQGEQGFITPDLLRRHLPAQYRRFQYFVCGPPALMNAMERMLPEIGVPHEQVHTERFDLV